jgi:hypothetical protein
MIQMALTGMKRIEGEKSIDFPMDVTRALYIYSMFVMNGVFENTGGLDCWIGSRVTVLHLLMRGTPCERSWEIR